MDLMEVNPALAKTEAEAGRCGSPYFSSFREL
jgi:hypothetical protein